MGMRSVHNEPLKKHTGNLLLYNLLLGFYKQMKHQVAKEKGMAVGVAKMVGDGT